MSLSTGKNYFIFDEQKQISNVYSWSLSNEAKLERDKEWMNNIINKHSNLLEIKDKAGNTAELNKICDPERRTSNLLTTFLDSSYNLIFKAYSFMLFITPSTQKRSSLYDLANSLKDDEVIVINTTDKSSDNDDFSLRTLLLLNFPPISVNEQIMMLEFSDSILELISKCVSSNSNGEVVAISPNKAQMIDLEKLILEKTESELYNPNTIPYLIPDKTSTILLPINLYTIGLKSQHWILLIAKKLENNQVKIWHADPISPKLNFTNTVFFERIGQGSINYWGFIKKIFNLKDHIDIIQLNTSAYQFDGCSCAYHTCSLMIDIAHNPNKDLNELIKHSEVPSDKTLFDYISNTISSVIRFKITSYILATCKFMIKNKQSYQDDIIYPNDKRRKAILEDAIIKKRKIALPRNIRSSSLSSLKSSLSLKFAQYTFEPLRIFGNILNIIVKYKDEPYLFAKAIYREGHEDEIPELSSLVTEELREIDYQTFSEVKSYLVKNVGTYEFPGQWRQFKSVYESKAIFYLISPQSIQITLRFKRSSSGYLLHERILKFLVDGGILTEFNTTKYYNDGHTLMEAIFYFAYLDDDQTKKENKQSNFKSHRFIISELAKEALTLIEKWDNQVLRQEFDILIYSSIQLELIRFNLPGIMHIPSDAVKFSDKYREPSKEELATIKSKARLNKPHSIFNIIENTLEDKWENAIDSKATIKIEDKEQPIPPLTSLGSIIETGRIIVRSLEQRKGPKLYFDGNFPIKIIFNILTLILNKAKKEQTINNVKVLIACLAHFFEPRSINNFEFTDAERRIIELIGNDGITKFNFLDKFYGIVATEVTVTYKAIKNYIENAENLLTDNKTKKKKIVATISETPKKYFETPGNPQYFETPGNPQYFETPGNPDELETPVNQSKAKKNVFRTSTNSNKSTNKTTKSNQKPSNFSETINLNDDEPEVKLVDELFKRKTKK